MSVQSSGPDLALRCTSSVIWGSLMADGEAHPLFFAQGERSLSQVERTSLLCQAYRTGRRREAPRPLADALDDIEARIDALVARTKQLELD